MAASVDLETTWGSRSLPFTVVHQDRATLRITVVPEGKVIVYAPREASTDQVTARVARRGGWITRQLERFDQWSPRTPPRQYISGETHLYLGKQYRLLVREAEGTGVSVDGDRIRMWTRAGATHAQRRAILRHWYKLQAHRIFPARVDAAWPAFSSKFAQRPGLIIREMTQRWGSFTPTGRLVINTELVRASPGLIDYVVTHELAHGVHPDHGAPWQALMSEKMPDWRDRKAALERQLL